MSELTKAEEDRAFARLNRKFGKSQGYIVNGRKVENLQYAHKQVVAVARGIAHELYSSMMRNDAAYKNWKTLCEDVGVAQAEATFVRLATPWLLDDARATMAKLLGQPGKEHLKEGIFDALLKDNSIRGTDGLIPVAPAVKEAFRGRR